MAMNDAPAISLRDAAHSWLGVSVSIVVALIVGAVLQRIIALALARFTHENTIVGAVTRAVRRPFNWLLPLLTVQFALSSAPDDVAAIDSVRHLDSLAIIIAMTWAAARAIAAAANTLVVLHPLTVADNLEARRIATQSRVLGRTLTLIVGLIGFSVALMTFPTVRSIGTSLLASAGVAGLAIGLAAKSVLGNLLAGVQLALTQPLRIDDVLIVDGESGNVEEITGTYVVLKLWDERRMIVPLQWFIENPFENWTRASSELIGTVMLWVDYRMPVEPLRTELKRLCEAAPEWDRRVCGLQVTDATDLAIQLRCLVSAADAGRSFDLRCRIREGLVAFAQSQHGDFLPQRRAEVHGIAPPMIPAGAPLPPPAPQ